jgi:hypothetical protein
VRAVQETHGFSEDSHELGELVCEEGQHGGEGTETSREQDEEWQFLLRVHRHLMKHCFHMREIQREHQHTVHTLYTTYSTSQKFRHSFVGFFIFYIVEYW